MADGTAYVVVGGYPFSTLVALDAANGGERCRVEVAVALATSAIRDGVASALTADGLLALNAADGLERWRYDAKRLRGSPVVGDGFVVVGGRDGLVALDAMTGTEAWTFQPDDPNETLLGTSALADRTRCCRPRGAAVRLRCVLAS